jgi:hypothetical protein
MADAAVGPTAGRITATEGGATITERILQLRQAPHPLAWDLVAQALDLRLRALRQQRWLIAAELVAQGAGWTDAAAHPAVDFNPDTLRKQHAKAKLPGGLSWGDYVEQYQTALRERTVELQQERGRALADRIQAIAERVVEFSEFHQDLIADYRQNPPDLFITPVGLRPSTEKVCQLTIAFNGEQVETKRDRLTVEFASYLQVNQHEQLKMLERLARIVGALPQAESEQGEDASQHNASLATVEELQAEALMLSAELQRYTADGEAVA